MKMKDHLAQKRGGQTCHDEELAKKMSEIARAQQVSSKVLVITWLREKMSEYAV
jgi:hypothetical protein